ncbi:MAG: peptidylprolyl isomerase, partial [Ruminiclostridium sp.]|nr:peptidylprolyl isomerase [Ruminiclostridium sp.]
LINSTTAAEVTAYRKDGDDKKADEILQEALAKVKFRIDEAYEKLEKGTAWKDVQKEYNDETSSNEVDFTVYPKSTTVLQKITDTAMGIEKKGGYSEIFETDKGYFILYYKDDLTLTDERMKELTKQADEFLRDQKAYEPIADFLEKYPYAYEYGLLDIDDPDATTQAPMVAS